MHVCCGMCQRIPEGNPLPESVIRQAEELCRKHLIAFKLEALKSERLIGGGARAEHLHLDLMCRRCEAEHVNQVDVNSIVKLVHTRLPHANAASASEMRSELTPELKKDECLFLKKKKIEDHSLCSNSTCCSCSSPLEGELSQGDSM